jgi:hypothetical protein
MKIRRSVLALVGIVVALAVAVSTAGALPIPPRYQPAKPPAPVPANVIVVKTVATLGSSYPWVQPRWVMVHGVMLPTLPTAPVSASVQPPSWIPIG